MDYTLVLYLGRYEDQHSAPLIVNVDLPKEFDDFKPENGVQFSGMEALKLFKSFLLLNFNEDPENAADFLDSFYHRASHECHEDVFDHPYLDFWGKIKQGRLVTVFGFDSFLRGEEPDYYEIQEFEIELKEIQVSSCYKGESGSDD